MRRSVQVAHYLDSDYAPWTDQLSFRLFSSVMKWHHRLPIWQCLSQFQGFDGVLTAIFRASKVPLTKKVERTPNEWQAHVVNSLVLDGHLTATDACLDQCCSFSHSLTSITALSIKSDFYFSPYSAIASTIACLPSLLSLTVQSQRDQGVKLEAISSVMSAIKAQTALTTLRLFDDKPGVFELPDTGLAAVADCVSHLHSLKHLEVGCLQRADVTSIKKLGVALVELQSLTAITLAGTPQAHVVRFFDIFSPKACGLLVQSLAACGRLERLTISHGNLSSSAGVVHFGQTFAALAALKSVAIEKCSLKTSDSYSELRNLLTGLSLATNLTQLSLQDSICLSDRLSDLRCLTSLRSLVISGRLYHEGDGAALSGLGAALSHLTALTKLEYHPEIDFIDPDLDSVFTAVGHLRQLEHLSLSGWCSVDHIGHLNSALARLSVLTCLELTGMDSDDEYAEYDFFQRCDALLGGIACMCTLRKLCFDWCRGLVYHSLGTFVTRMTQLTGLHELRFVSRIDRALPPEVCAALIDQAAHMPQLEVLSVLDPLLCERMDHLALVLPHVRAARPELQLYEGPSEGPDDGPGLRLLRAALQSRGQHAAA